MLTDSRFEIGRFWQLIKNDLFTNYRALLIAGGAAIGILLFINIISILGSREVLVPIVFYPLMLFIGGYIVTSVAFNDLHHPQRSYVYLTLPASNLEKFLSKLLLTTLGYVLGTLVLYFLFSVLMSLINVTFFGHGYPLFNPFDEVVWTTIGIYVITQSIFLLGAAFFRKNAFLKTVFTLFILQIALSLFVGLLARILFWKYFSGWEFGFDDMIISSHGLEQSLENFFIGFGHLMKFVFFYLLAPFLWFVTYFQLKETEA